MSFDFLTMEEAASKVRVTRRCLDRWIAAGVGPKLYHVSHRKLIRVDDLEAWVEGQPQSGAALPSPAPAACEVAPA